MDDNDTTRLRLVEADIDQIQHALSTGIVTCVELVAGYLKRISTYDCRGTSLNSIPILNPNVFDEAAASDERRAAGKSRGRLDGVPFTVKDSYKVKGLTVANGSSAFQDLIAGDDAFVVHRLRAAGAVLIGKTNMCPMAAGGMARGVYGRAESPYNLEYLAAAWASGSSNGSGVSTAASLAAFGMGGETVSSGRSPASNNALVAYTPSWGAISLRGTWPLYPTCDVVVPHTRCMSDLFDVLDVVVAQDQITTGDFWRDQRLISLPSTWEQDRPESFRNLGIDASVQGVRIAVPSMYVGGKQVAGISSVYTNPEVVHLYQQAKAELEARGATVIEIDEFPIVQHYEFANTSHNPTSTANHEHQYDTPYRLPDNWHTTERSLLVAYAWEQFLQENGDINISSLKHVDLDSINPALPRDDPQVRYSEPTNRIHYDQLHSFIDSVTTASSSRPPAALEESEGGVGEDGDVVDAQSALMSVQYLKQALETLDLIRREHFEGWLIANSFDLVMLPACGDVGRADADVNYESAEHAWRNGVKYSNGNRALRHVGIPSVTVPMGQLGREHRGADMPVGLTFLGRAGDDVKLLRWASAYEQISQQRRAPKLTPELGLGHDVFQSTTTTKYLLSRRRARPDLRIEKCVVVPASPRHGQGMLRVSVHGFVTCASEKGKEDAKSDSSVTSDSRDGEFVDDDENDKINSSAVKVEISIDAQDVPHDKIELRKCHGTMCGRRVWDFRCTVVVPEPPSCDERDKVTSRKKIARDSTMVVVLVREDTEGKEGIVESGWSSGYMKLL